MFEDLTEQELEQLERNRKYWGERAAATQQKLTKKSIRETEFQLREYYSNAMTNCIGQFEKTYNKILLSKEEGKEPTPADLYKLDTYLQMQAQLKKELEKLGSKQAALFSEKFADHYMQVYEELALKGDLFNTVDRQAAQQMINHIWCADGKRWSDRVWTNINYLQSTLNDGLLDCLVTGKKTSELKRTLQERFNVSFNSADGIVRTEMAHIQTQAAQQCYMDAGIEEVEILADKDERQCDICGKLHGKRYLITEKLPIPAHPRCRCCVIPVVENEKKVETENLGYREDPQLQKVAPKQYAEQKEQDLTLQGNNDSIQLNSHQQQAQQRTMELNEVSILRLNSYNASHTQHAFELTGLPKNTKPKELYEAYEKLCTDFFKLEIDGKVVDGFIGADGTLYKINKKSGLFGMLFSDNKFGSVYKLDRGDIEKRWEKYKKRFLKEKAK